MSYPFVREFQVLLAPFVRFGALSTELDILSMGDRVRLLSSALPPQICSNNVSSAPLSLTVFPARIQVQQHISKRKRPLQPSLCFSMCFCSYGSLWADGSHNRILSAQIGIWRFQHPFQQQWHR